MKQETKELIRWLKNLIWENKFRCEANIFEFERFDKAVSFLDSLSEIESRLTKGGYIQDRNGIPCCDGDKVKFQFSKKGFDTNWKDNYSITMTGKLQWSTDTNSFAIIFGPNKNGYDWIDWTDLDYGPEWFEKIKE